MATRHPHHNLLQRMVDTMAPDCRRTFGDIQRLQVTPEKAEDTAAKAIQRILEALQETLQKTKQNVYLMPETAPENGWMIGFADRRNFAHGRVMGTYAVLMENNVATWAGYLDFLAGQVYWAEKSAGSHTDMRLRVSGRTELQDGILLLPWRTLDVMEMNLLPWASKQGLHTRKSSQPVQDALALAAGQADVLIHASLPPAETQLMNLFMSEAGAVVTDVHGKPITAESTSLIAANNKLQAEVRKSLQG